MFRHLESGLVLTAATVVLTDQGITHVGDPRAVETSCSYVDLVDISSNALSDWNEVGHRSDDVSLLIAIDGFRFRFYSRHYPM